MYRIIRPFVSLCFAGLLLAACAPVLAPTPVVIVVTATPVLEPTQPRPTSLPPTLTPTREPANPHALLPAFSIINADYDLSGEKLTRSIGERVVDYPKGWQPAGDARPYPYLYKCQGDDCQGYYFQPHYIAGSFGLAQDGVMLFPDQRYIVKVIAAISMKGSGTLSIAPVIYNTDGGTRTQLTPQAVPNLGYREFVWAIETRADQPTIRLEALFDIQWATFESGSVINLVAVQILTAPPDWGNPQQF